MKNKIIKISVYILICIFAAVLGLFFYFNGSYMLMSAEISLICCVAFFVHYEKSDTTSLELVHLCTVIALSIALRCMFSAVPFFKPVTAIVIISGLYFGKEFAFLAGAMSALLSNFIFSQGLWTPFQMIAWGMCGFLAAAMSGVLKKNRLLLCLYSAFAGLLYSLIVDINTVMWIDKSFTLQRYIAVCITSAPYTLTYAISNLIFILILGRPLEKTFKRLKKKYG